jgi:hypothetical protein
MRSRIEYSGTPLERTALVMGICSISIVSTTLGAGDVSPPRSGVIVTGTGAGPLGSYTGSYRPARLGRGRRTVPIKPSEHLVRVNVVAPGDRRDR